MPKKRCEHLTYIRKIDSGTIEQYAKNDSDWGVDYIEDYHCIEKTSGDVLRKSNLSFLKILNQCELFYINSRGKFIWKEALSLEKIKIIVEQISEGYKNGTFYDSDLGDDIFEHYNVVSPIVAHDKALRKQFIKKNLDKFSNKKECEDFIKIRSKLFCLYVFLRRVAILYRDTKHKKPFQLLSDLLSDKRNYNKFKERYLRVKQTLYADDYWATGLHEWLTCETTIIALKRTAGLLQDVQPCLKPVEGELIFHSNRFVFNDDGKLVRKKPSSTHFTFGEFNWLDFQFLVRTGTNHVIFHDFNGHPGAVHKEIVETESKTNARPTKGKGQKTKGSNLFHQQIVAAFKRSETIDEYMKEIFDIYYEYVLNDLTEEITPTKEQFFLCNGTPTNNYKKLRFFQENELKPSRESMDNWREEIDVQHKLSFMKDGGSMRL